MLEAACDAVDFVQTVDQSAFEENRQLQYSLVRCIEIIGEAAARLSNEFREAHPQVPWRAIVNMRNRLIHAYFDIDLDLVWTTVTVEIPSLIVALREMLADP
jgi:uncharacterized protein with HEPN domain